MTIRPDLNKFDSVTLHQLDAVRLQDRMDTKYVFNASRLQLVLDLLPEYYKCLQIDGIRSFGYESEYFDSDKFKLYFDHYCGKLNRYKVRLRKYTDSGLRFFEVKAKNNKYRTVKSRIQLTESDDPFKLDSVKVLGEVYKFNNLALRSKLRVEYNRITLTDVDCSERVTIDTGLNFVNGTTSIDKSYLVTAEVKQMRSAKSVFAILMKHLHIRPVGLSKYCFGVNSLYPGVKHNNFKPGLLYFRKLAYDTTAKPQSGIS
ncbi:MAG TPA: polyphosphate polymerase domain-containing protein [Bacteroidia bacterium]|nr:polyphosphate polymerase domain-containing protein [Bacteroidia bacterium]